MFAYPYSGYWVDVGTISSYWQAHMDLLVEEPPVDLNERGWVVHTKTEEQPPVRIMNGATVIDSMITDGSVIYPGARVERSILSPGVRVLPDAVVRESVILTDTVIGSGAVVERSIIDKRVTIGEQARIGGIVPGDEPLITMIGKNSDLSPGIIVEPGAIIGTDVIPADLSGSLIRGDDYVQTKRLPFEI